MERHLTDAEYKKLVIDITLSISASLIERKPDSASAAENIALYARDIADAVDSILKSKF